MTTIEDDLAKLQAEFAPARTELSETPNIDIRHEARQIERVDLPEIASLLTISDSVSVTVTALSELEELEIRVAELKSYIHKMKTQHLPQLFIAAKTTEFGTNRYVLSTKEYVSVNMPENSDPAFKWMQEQGYGSLIKNSLTLNFNKGDEERAAEARKELEKYWDVLTTKSGVHGATMMSFLKGQIKSGSAIPLDLFGAKVGTMIEIKPRKG